MGVVCMVYLFGIKRANVQGPVTVRTVTKLIILSNKH